MTELNWISIFFICSPNKTFEMKAKRINIWVEPFSKSSPLNTFQLFAWMTLLTYLFEFNIYVLYLKALQSQHTLNPKSNKMQMSNWILHLTVPHNQRRIKIHPQKNKNETGKILRRHSDWNSGCGIVDVAASGALCAMEEYKINK